MVKKKTIYVPAKRIFDMDENKFVKDLFYEKAKPKPKTKNKK
ncbi:MAG TPA: hypothetical protein VMV95_02465 [Bacillota bacterium]|nr:hypothetical protein [Bacillota bacterium]